MMNAERLPPWVRGSVSTLDSGAYERTVVALRGHEITEAQRRAVVQVITQARAQGQSLDVLDPMAPRADRLASFGALLRGAIERGEVPGIRLADPDMVQRLYDATIGWGDALQRLLDDPEITEVKLIGTTAIGLSAQGRVVLPQVYPSPDEPIRRVQAMAQIHGIPWDAMHPSITLPLGHKTRLHATRAPLVPDGEVLLVFRRGRRQPWTLADLVQRGACDAATAAVLERLVQSGASLIVAGPQDSGKTTLLECLANAAPGDRHVIVVEDATDEFRLRTPLVTRLLVQGRSGESLPHGYAEVVRETLRMTPDILIPGEVRGVEAAAVLQMAEAGRPTMTTIHAATPEAALRRLARLASAPGAAMAGFTYATALHTVTTAFHAVIQMRLSPRLGRRLITHVMAIAGVAEGEQVRLTPLVTAQIDTTRLPAVVQWRLADADVEATLRAAPPAIADLLIHAAPGVGGYQAQRRDSRTEYDRLMAQAHQALQTMTTPHAAIEALTHAAALEPDRPEVWNALDQLSARFPDYFQALETDIAQALQQAASAVQRLDHDHAATILQTITARVDRVFVARRMSLWHEVRQQVERMTAHAEQAKQALATAWTLAAGQRRYDEALRVLGQVPVRATPRALALEVVRARQAVVDAWERMLEPERIEERRAAERYRAVNRADQEWLAALEAPPAPGMPASPPHHPPSAAAGEPGHVPEATVGAVVPDSVAHDRTSRADGAAGPTPMPESALQAPIRMDAAADVGVVWPDVCATLGHGAARPSDAVTDRA